MLPARCIQYYECADDPSQTKQEDVPCDTPPPPPTPGDYYDEPQDCPAGQAWSAAENKCVPGNLIACRNGDGSWRLFQQDGDLDNFNDVYYGNAPNAYANGVNYPEGVVASISSQQYCDNNPIPTEPEQVVPAPDVPATVPAPTPTQTPTPAPTPSVRPQPSGGFPGAFQPIPLEPSGPMPTQDVFRPAAQRPQEFVHRAFPCGGQVPFSVRLLRTETAPSRPDLWKDQWT
jgi:hypothetical protein